VSICCDAFCGVCAVFLLSNVSSKYCIPPICHAVTVKWVIRVQQTMNMDAMNAFAIGGDLFPLISNTSSDPHTRFMR